MSTLFGVHPKLASPSLRVVASKKQNLLIRPHPFYPLNPRSILRAIKLGATIWDAPSFWVYTQLWQEIGSLDKTGFGLCGF